MVDIKPSSRTLHRAATQNQKGLDFYVDWEMDQAIIAFQKAAAGDPENPEYHLNLARAYARGGNYPEAMRSLGDYLHVETDENIAGRYERLFSSALDDVEQICIDGMRSMNLPVKMIGKAIQMWLEYRLTVGRRPLRLPKPELWSGALTYTICKINFVEIDRAEIADVYEINERAIKEKFDVLRETLDLMPADYRYFVGEENPLDKLIEAAELLDQIYASFRED